MRVTLLMTKDKNNTIGTLSGIPWDCTEIHNDMAKLIKGKVVVMGTNAKALLGFVRKVKLKRLIVLSRVKQTELKTISYVPDVYSAMILAKQYNTDVYVLGGNETMQSFLNEGLITDIKFYIVNAHNDGIKFVNSAKYDFSVVEVENRDDYVISTYTKVPPELSLGKPLECIDSSKENKFKSNNNLNKMSKSDIESAIDDELHDIEYGLYDDDAVISDTSVLSENLTLINTRINELYQCMDVYANNEKNVVNRMNKLTEAHQVIVTMRVAADRKISLLEDKLNKLTERSMLLSVGVGASLALVIVELVAILCLR